MNAHPRLSINQATIKYAPFDEALALTAAAGVQSIGVWREPIAELGLDEAGRRLSDSGLRFSSLCRAGFFTMLEGPARRSSIDDNRRAIDETAAMAAAGAEGSAAVLVLVAGGVPEITIKSRPVRTRFIRQLAKNIRAVLRDLDPAVVVNGVWDNLELETRITDAKALKDMTERLSCMPGIAHFLQVDEYPLGDFDDITEKCKQHFGSEIEGKSFSVRCKRAGKHSFSSMDVEKYVGSKLRRECGAAGI